MSMSKKEGQKRRVNELRGGEGDQEKCTEGDKFKKGFTNLPAKTKTTNRHLYTTLLANFALQTGSGAKQGVNKLD